MTSSNKWQLYPLRNHTAHNIIIIIQHRGMKKFAATNTCIPIIRFLVALPSKLPHILSLITTVQLSQLPSYAPPSLLIEARLRNFSIGITWDTTKT